MKVLISLGFIALSGVLALAQSTTPQQSNVPVRGYVPDEKTAVAIAEAVLIPVYGEKKIPSERPFKAKLEGETWTVTGTLYCGDGSTGLCKGGTAEVRLSKKDGKILSMIHYK